MNAIRTKLNNSIDKAELTVEITMQLGDWNRLLEQLGMLQRPHGYYPWPLSDVVTEIQNALRNISNALTTFKTFDPPAELPKNGEADANTQCEGPVPDKRE